MFNLMWPILIVVASNCLYNICAKSTPANVNTFLSLTVNYLVAGILSVIIFFITKGDKSLSDEVGKLNWTSIALGLSIIGLEFGYIWIYRVGWKVSVGSLVANIVLACALLLVGFLLYKEAISVRQIVGMVVCGVGLVLISK